MRPEIAHGRARLRCVLCNKVAYHTQDEAEHAAARIWADRQYPMKVYHKTTCGWWHLATARARQGADNARRLLEKVTTRTVERA